MQYVLGIILIGVGFVITWQADWITNTFGRIPFAEKYLGMEGGTRLFWKLLGIITIIFSFLYMSGGTAWILGKIFGSTVETLEQ